MSRTGNVLVNGPEQADRGPWLWSLAPDGRHLRWHSARLEEFGEPIEGSEVGPLRGGGQVRRPHVSSEANDVGGEVAAGYDRGGGSSRLHG